MADFMQSITTLAPPPRLRVEEMTLRDDHDRSRVRSAWRVRTVQDTLVWTADRELEQRRQYGSLVIAIVDA